MGVIFGIVIVLSVEFFDKVAKIDDPVGAISVHGVCGALGSILVGRVRGRRASTEAGVLWRRIPPAGGADPLGVVTVAAYVAVVITAGI